MSDAKEAYEFAGGYPTPATVQQAYDDIDLNRAIHAYRFFYPTVSVAAIYKGNLKAGVIPNKAFIIMYGNPNQIVLTPNSDTPYAGGAIDLTEGPIIVDLPPGPLMCVVNDLNQRYVMDMGLPGPDAGKGGRHAILPPGFAGTVPSGYYTGTATTNRVVLMLRAMPQHGDNEAAVKLLKTVKVYPISAGGDAPESQWIDLGKMPIDFTADSYERGLDFWKELHEVVDSEPPFEAYRMYYGELAALGIVKGRAFAPDARMQRILARAAEMANDQMRVQSFADRRSDRVVWPDRKWEWAVLRPENGTFDLAAYKDLEAREKWFFQAAIESPAMFRRSPGAGSLYWLGTHDTSGAYLSGSKSYKLSVPLPAPAKLFWSVTVYDAVTRSEILTNQNKAALRSLFELKDAAGDFIDLYFGPTPPADAQDRWIQTIAGKGWFVYFRVYGPEAAAFDGSWKPGDFEVMHE
jgi:hypothetical protein